MVWPGTVREILKARTAGSTRSLKKLPYASNRAASICVSEIIWFLNRKGYEIKIRKMNDNRNHLRTRTKYRVLQKYLKQVKARRWTRAWHAQTVAVYGYLSSWLGFFIVAWIRCGPGRKWKWEQRNKLPFHAMCLLIAPAEARPGAANFLSVCMHIVASMLRHSDWSK